MGCSAAADLGVRAAAAIVEGALKGGSSGGSSSPAPAATAEEPPAESACRKKLRAWREAGNERADPPPHLRCGPNGEWPDENDVRSTTSSPGF